MRQILTEGFAQLGLKITDDMLDKFEIYNAYLAERNEVMNLTAITGDENVARLHFLDCAALATLRDFSGKSVIDVGTGAGFPGIPLKIICPDIHLTLLDAQQKRVTFLQETCDKLGFKDVNCLWARAEDAAIGQRETFDFAVSRAVARLNVLCELCLPFVKQGGSFIAMKGAGIDDEVREAERASSVLGGGWAKVRKYTIPGADADHSAVIIKKQRAGSVLYPRPFNQIKKNPL